MMDPIQIKPGMREGPSCFSVLVIAGSENQDRYQSPLKPQGEVLGCAANEWGYHASADPLCRGADRSRPLIAVAGSTMAEEESSPVN